MNFHIFVAIATFAFYILLKFYKHSILKNNSNTNKNNTKNKSNFIYILFIPVVIYITRYFFCQYNNNQYNYYTTPASQAPQTPYMSQMQANVSQMQAPMQVVSDKLLNSPYPVSSSSSYSSSY
jgi:hypothetical protein